MSLVDVLTKSTYTLASAAPNGNQTHYLAVLILSGVILFPKQSIQIRPVMSGETLCVLMAVDSSHSMLFLSVLQARGFYEDTVAFAPGCKGSLWCG